MRPALVLRYSDYERNTVREHRKILNASGSKQVWWGWWKKDDEQIPDELVGLGNECPLEVGLVDRNTSSFFFARCERIAVAQPGTRRPSPNPALTPAYYRSDEFPAWFLLSHFEKVKEAKWTARYGAVPETPETIYLVADSASQSAPRLIRTIDVRPVQMPGSVILHLSDIHFGSEHEFPSVADPREPHTPTLLEHVLDVIAAVEERDQRVGCVVVSGDILSKDQKPEWNTASVFLEAIATRTALTPDHFVIVPGNHDVPLDEDETPTRNYATVVPYLNFVSSFYGRKVRDENEMRWLIDPNGVNYFFLALNSAKPRAKNTRDYGFVGHRNVEPLLRTLERLQANTMGERCITIAVLHHHLISTPEELHPDGARPVSVTLDATRLLRTFRAVGVDVVIHGHEHLPMLVKAPVFPPASDDTNWAMPDRDIWIVAGGTAGAKRDLLWDDAPFNSPWTVAESNRSVLARRARPVQLPDFGTDVGHRPWS